MCFKEKNPKLVLDDIQLALILRGLDLLLHKYELVAQDKKDPLYKHSVASVREVKKLGYIVKEALDNLYDY